jgi:aryl carrier-like protein
LPAVERRPFVLQFLSDMVTTALKLRTEEPLDPRQRLFEIGVDSILALEMKDRLAHAVGVRLSATLLFVYPTLESLAGYILTELVGETDPVSAAAASPASESDLSEAALTQMLLREIDVSRGA